MTFSLRQGEKGDDDDDDDELFLIFFHKSEKLTQGQKIPRTVRILHKEKNSIGMQQQAGDKNMSRLNIKKKPNIHQIRPLNNCTFCLEYSHDPLVCRSESQTNKNNHVRRIYRMHVLLNKVTSGDNEHFARPKYFLWWAGDETPLFSDLEAPFLNFILLLANCILCCQVSSKTDQDPSFHLEK